MSTEKKKFVTACMMYFGKKPGQTLQGFMDEVRKLTPQDRDDLKGMLQAELGCEIEA
jgi:hypothetical protein